MKINEIFTQKVTILNKLKAVDSLSKTDVWYKTTIENAVWYEKSQSSVNGTTVQIGTSIIVEIPFNERYKPYKDWKTAGGQLGHFTLSAGDYVIVGDVEEDINSNNITKVVSKYEPQCCTVRHFRELPKRGLSVVQLYVEGV